jgi:hypothetical protein
MTKDDMRFDRGNLQFMLQGYEMQLEQTTSNIEGLHYDLMELLGPQMGPMVPMVLSQLVNACKDEDTATEFAKNFIYMKRLVDKAMALQTNITVVKALLDENGPLRLAGVNFDSLEVKDDDGK